MAVLDCIKKFLFCTCRCCFGSAVSVDSQWKPARNEKGRHLSLHDPDPPEQDSHNRSFARSSPFLCNSVSSYDIHSPSSQTQSIPFHFKPTPLKRVPSVSDAEFTMPEMHPNHSSVLTKYQVSALFLTLSSRLRLYPWTLVYSITRNGCSLANLCSKLANYDQTLLLLITDTRKTSFGAVLSAPNIKLKGKTYTGTPETFLFTFYPKLRKFLASGENNYFVQAMPDGISIGGWRPALWLDDNLEKGTTNTSATFDNSPLTDEHFIVRELECWALTENVEELEAVEPTPMYQNFPSNILASKKAVREVGSVRCGRLSKKYHPTWRPEKDDHKAIFSLGEENEDEKDNFEISQGDIFDSSQVLTKSVQPRLEVTTPQRAAPGGWSSIYQ